MRVKTDKKLHIYEYIENEIKEGRKIPSPKTEPWSINFETVLR